jgi:hypothetical protein
LQALIQRCAAVVHVGSAQARRLAYQPAAGPFVRDVAAVFLEVLFDRQREREVFSDLAVPDKQQA